MFAPGSIRKTGKGIKSVKMCLGFSDRKLFIYCMLVAGTAPALAINDHRNLIHIHLPVIGTYAPLYQPRVTRNNYAKTCLRTYNKTIDS